MAILRSIGNDGLMKIWFPLERMWNVSEISSTSTTKISLSKISAIRTMLFNVSASENTRNLKPSSK